MIDRHLVMNTLSRVVAQQPEGDAAELLYCLSDYLHCALGDLPEVTWPIQREWQLLENAVPLRAYMSDASIESQLRNRCPADLPLPRGLLVAVLDAALHGCSPRRGGQWRLELEATPGPRGPASLALRLRLASTSEGFAFDAAAAVARITPVLKRPGVAALLEGRVALLTQDTLECRLAPWPEAPQGNAMGSDR